MLYLQDDRDDHRSASGLSLDIPFEVEPYFFFDHGPIHALFVTGVGHGLADDDSGFAYELDPFVGERQTALNDFGGGFQFTGGFIDRDDGQHYSVISQMLPIAQHQFVYPARARIVDQGASHRHLIHDLRAVFVELDGVATFGKHNTVARNSPIARGFGMAVKLAGFAVDRDQEFGPH